MFTMFSFITHNFCLAAAFELDWWFPEQLF